MALTLTHEAFASVDSTSLVLKNTTPISEYTDNIPAITNESELSTATTAITIDIVSDDYTFDYNATITSEKDNLRSANGAYLNISNLFGEDVINDNLYNITITYTISAVDYAFSFQSVLYSQVKNSIAVSILASEWKDSLNYKSKSSTSKYALKVKSWFDQLVVANSKGLYSEALTILNSLKSIL